MSSSLFRPFKAVRPVPALAAQVVAPPYDVLDSAEARVKAQGKPYSFLHVSKAEIDLPETVSPYDDAVYAKSAENYRALLEKGVLKRDEKPCYYVYRAQMGDHVQTGLAVAASVDAYDAGRIRRHELTRVDKENDRVRQIRALNAQTGPALLAYKQIQKVQEIIDKTVKKTPAYAVAGENGTTHTLWVMDDDDDIRTVTEAFDAVDVVYIADGHHRSAAASRIAKERKAENPRHTGEEAYNYFLAVAFPMEQMKIFDYNRVVADLNGMTPETFVAALEKTFDVTPVAGAESPKAPKTFRMYLAGKWYALSFKTTPDLSDPVKALDVSLLSAFVLEPLLGIGDPRTDKRIDFIGGVRGVKALADRVDAGKAAVAFAMYPTQMTELAAVADAGQIMPPKSTWFEPKLEDGMVSNPTD